MAKGRKVNISSGKIVGIILATVVVILFIVLFNFFRPRYDLGWNVITMQDGEVVDVDSAVMIRKSDSDVYWYIDLIPGADIQSSSYTWGTNETVSESLVNIGEQAGETYMAYLSSIYGHRPVGYGRDERNIVMDEDFTILLIESSTYDYYNYVAYKGEPEDGAAAFAELSRFIDVEEFGVTTYPFVEEFDVTAYPSE